MSALQMMLVLNEELVRMRRTRMMRLQKGYGSWRVGEEVDGKLLPVGGPEGGGA